MKRQRGPIAWMARNAVAANLLMLLFLVGGAATFRNITQEFFPDIATDTITVSVAYPGAGPEEVEDGIILVVEEAVRGLNGIGEVTATAQEGSGIVVAEVIDTADPTIVYQDVKSAIDRIRTLPEEAERPQVTLDVRNRMELTVLLWGDASEAALRSLANTLRERLLNHPAITQVELRGVKPLEISIEVPQENLRRYGLTLGEIATRLRNESVELPAGGVKTDRNEILVRVSEKRDWGEDFAKTPIVTDADGVQLLLGDIAIIKDGFAEEDRISRYNGQPSIAIDVYRVGKQTPPQVRKATEAVLDAVRPNLPKGIDARIRFSFAEMFEQRATLLIKNGALGLCLVLLLLGCFLELRLAFWVMMGIPVSFLGSMLLMPAAGLSINMLTMFAFILALGIVVDDAIVVGENIYHYRQNGMSPLEAAIRGAREVALPIAFSILTNCVAFIPLMMMPGMMGKFMKMLPMVVIATFLISWIECLFVLPSHLGHQKDRVRGKLARAIHERQQRFSHAFAAWVRNRYAPFLRWAVKRRYLVVATALAILITTIAYIASGRLGFELFPTVESDFSYGTCTLPYGVAIEQTDATLRKMEAAAHRAARNLGHPELIEGIQAEVQFGNSHEGEITVYLPDAKIRDQLKIGTQTFTDAWRKEIGQIPGVSFLRLAADRGGPGSGPALTVELRHPNMGILEKAADELATDLQTFPLVRDPDPGFQQGKPQIDFTLTPTGKALGLTARDVALQVRHAYEGAEVLRQQRGRDEIKVKVRLPRAERESVHDLQGLILRTPGGGEIPLTEAVTWQRSYAYKAIQRRDGKRALTVRADVRPKSKVPEVTQELVNTTLPALMRRYPGLTFSFEGRQADNRKSLNSLKTAIPMVLIAIFALLAVPFRSYAQPLIVMVSIPFGIVGATIGHLLMRYQFSMIGLIGIVALSGVVVNDALVLIDFANRMREKHATALEAIVAAGVQRFRPIMLTTLTTFGGLMPMIFETSRQARFLIPMAISLGYGLLFATLITLLLVPSLYLIVEDARSAIGNLAAKSE
jgi:multidrug efflux pump subunit AcrB